MRQYSTGVLAVLATCVLTLTVPVSAQNGRFGSAGASTETPIAAGGWNVTPSVLWGTGWDSNVLLKGRGDDEHGDMVNVLNPRAEASRIGRRGYFSGTYDGAFLLYRELSALNSYDQHGSVAAKHQLSKHVTLSLSDSFSASPTTELALLVGVPFTRTGVRTNEAHGGVEAELSKRTAINAAYQFEWVQFDLDPAFVAVLRGGHSHGGSFGMRHKLSERTALTAEYDRHFSTVGGPEVFDTQNASIGFDRQVTEAIRIAAAGGFSRAGENAFGPALTRPHYHIGASRRVQTGNVDVFYDRSFARSFGFGGTTDTTEFAVRANMPLSRKLYALSTLSWRSSSYLQVRDTTLDSRWFEASVGYMAQPWVRIEGYYGTSYQTAELPGSTYDRNRFGVQVITLKPMRIR